MEKKKNKQSEISDRVQEIISIKNVKTDPNGSYTGVPLNPYDKPVQDVDDL